MAIYHNAVKVTSRGAGESACASSAYISCSVLYNDYDGIRHDYTGKGGLVWEQVFLPPMAPAEWQDRETLWNAVEAAEKTKDSRLSRMHIVALPVELTKEEWIPLVTEYIQTQFVSDGMCVDVAIHDEDGHNPHAHIITTVRPLNQDGTWQNKTEKEYICVRNGEERGFTAAEFKEARNDGWEKQYPYLVGKTKVYMPASEGEAHGYERTSKYPKSTKYGRQNPIAARWNSETQLEQWRIAWEDISNKYLEHAGSEERIDHRSHAERGIDEQPTIHEGPAARMIEKKGGFSDRCELNRQIKKDNEEIRYWKSVIEKLKQIPVAVVDTIKDLAYKIEEKRQEIITGYYLLAHNDETMEGAAQYVAKMEPLLDDYMENHDKLVSARKDRKDLVREYDSLSPLHILKRKEFSQQIDVLDTRIAKLKKKDARILKTCGKTNHREMIALQEHVVKTKAAVQNHPAAKARQESIIDRAITALKDLFIRAISCDPIALMKERKAVRADIELKGTETIEKAIGKKHSFRVYLKSKEKADEIVDGVEREQKEQKPRRKEKPLRTKDTERIA